MERAIQRSDAREQANSERWDGRCGGTITPFKLPDESPSLLEWRLHNSEESEDKDHPLGFKESWSFGKVVFKRYLRYDGTETSLHRTLGSWERNSVNDAASRFLGVSQIGCTYSIRFRGSCLTLSGGSRTLQRLIEMAIRTKRTMLQLTPCEVEGNVSRRRPQGSEAFENKESE
ncbi:p20 protein [Cucumber necrosis virus]|uniref:RNA silencing suppressor p19 n=1 Tax=Cucumber necrosis virus TaxID=12143 RepID=P19_CNV|nr:p20 protein [Cucumber necrosis virus]P15184.1 RecName: Full=RNA silencing suppressor p19; AltName: Full=19 kDa symptom severity modulator [Cucumber necrosis virus]AAA42906.1 ORF p20 [Cucumber necrosis virus]